MTLLFAVDLLGVFCFALSGCLLAASKQFDIFGSLLLGILTGLGGGIMRDVVIGRPLPAAFDQPVYLLMPVAAVVVVRMGWLTPGRLRRTLLLFDAGGLALFCVSGTLIALQQGVNGVAAASMGVVTACGGGLLRDVVAREVPSLINRDGGLYAIPAAVGSALVVVAWHAGASRGSAVGPFELAVIGVVFAFRGLALRLGWKLPHAGPATRDEGRAHAVDGPRRR